MSIRDFSISKIRLMVPALVLVLPIWGLAQTPDFGWAKRAGGTGSEGGLNIAVDRMGNCYVTGWFSGAATFGGTTLSSSGEGDIFVIKCDSAGNVLWAKRAGGGSYDEGHGIAVDGAGNCYVTGYFTGPATFGVTNLTSGGNGDIFVAKYDSAGNLKWVRRAGGADEDRGNGIALDGMGGCLVTGFFSGTATFGGTTLTSSGQYDIFVAKYDSEGNVVWAKRAGGGSYDEGNGIAVDAAGNCYLTGDFYDSAGFGSTTITSNGRNNVFVAKYDSQGNVVWAKQAGGTEYDSGFGIAADSFGNCYVTGSFQGTATFGGTNLTTSGISAVFVAKFGSAGNAIWANQVGGGYHNASGVTVDGAGNCYVTGYFNGTATFGNTTLTSEREALFVAQYDNVGNVIWAKQTGGTGWGVGRSIALDGLGHS